MLAAADGVTACLSSLRTSLLKDEISFLLVFHVFVIITAVSQVFLKYQAISLKKKSSLVDFVA
jgi:hypothetical protein